MVRLLLTPNSYEFTSLLEEATILVDTDATKLTVRKVDINGSGLMEFDKDTSTITATRYGRATYSFTGEAPGKKSRKVDFNINVVRPEVTNKKEEKIYVALNKTTTVRYTPPSGYTFKRLEVLSDTKSNVSLNYRENIEVTGILLGTVEAEIVLVKNSDNDENLEYNGGKYTFQVMEAVIDPSVEELSVKLNETINIDSIKVLNSKITNASITFKYNYGGNTQIFRAIPTAIPNTTEEYSMVITGMSGGEGSIDIYVEDKLFHVIKLKVIDVKQVVLPKDAPEELTLEFGKSYKYNSIYYEDNGSNREMIVTYDTKSGLEVVLTPVPNRVYVYDLTITNNASDGFVGNIELKQPTSIEGRKYIKVTCKKEVKEGTITTSLGNIGITVIENRAVDIKWIEATFAERMEILVEDAEYLESKIEDIEFPLFEKDADGNQKSIVFPSTSATKKMFLFGNKIGKTNINIKSYVNEDQLVADVNIPITITSSDKLPDISSLVNIYPGDVSETRKKDVIIYTPDESATLVLREELSDDLKLEFGYSFDYVEKTNPKVNSNVSLRGKTGVPTWLNTETMEIFNCIDRTEDANVWIGSKGTYIGEESLPQPGDKNFGYGVAPEWLLEQYNLKPFDKDNVNKKEHDNYGHYKDVYNNVYVFIPKHYMLPICKPELADKYPYHGMEYKFSYTTTPEITLDCLPRCFINNGEIQVGIFVCKYNGIRHDKYKSYPYVDVYRSAGTNPTKIKTYNTYTSTDKYPELREMARIPLPVHGESEIKGRHNMTIFIQTMINNLTHCHINACYERNTKNDIVQNKQSTPYNVRYDTTNKEWNIYSTINKSRTNTEVVGHVRTKGYEYSTASTDIDPDYISMYTHNGFSNGILDLCGPLNIPLTGLIVAIDTNNPNKYKIYALKKEVDVAKIEADSFRDIADSNTAGVIFRTPLFNLTNNYDFIGEVDSELLKGMKYLNPYKPFYTNKLTGEHILTSGGRELTGYYSINTGINLFNILEDRIDEIYINTPDDSYGTIDKPHRFDNAVFYLSTLADNDKLIPSTPTTMYGFFTSNLGINCTEFIRSGCTDMGYSFTNPHTRFLKIIGQYSAIKLNGSVYSMSHRACITPNIQTVQGI